jgi:NADPH2:quinone reductase
MSKAIRLHETGGPDVLRWEDVEVGAPGEDQWSYRADQIHRAHGADE